MPEELVKQEEEEEERNRRGSLSNALVTGSNNYEINKTISTVSNLISSQLLSVIEEVYIFISTHSVLQTLI